MVRKRRNGLARRHRGRSNDAVGPASVRRGGPSASRLARRRRGGPPARRGGRAGRLRGGLRALTVNCSVPAVSRISSMHCAGQREGGAVSYRSEITHSPGRASGSPAGRPPRPACGTSLRWWGRRFQQSGSSTTSGGQPCQQIGEGKGGGEGYLYGQGSFSYTAIAQHHQLVQRHLPRHGVGRRSESASSMQVVSSARMRRTGHRSRASCYASEARHVVAESRLVFCSEFAADQRAHSLG